MAEQASDAQQRETDSRHRLASGDHTARSRPLRPGDPQRLGRYELIGRLGEGGMGTVFLAQAPDGRHVAVKMIRSDLADDADFRRRFRREVQRAREVPPFCTAEVVDADPEHAQPYLVVEYVDGPTLSAVVSERGPLSAANLHGLAVGVATALTAIHGAGVIHRDLKPGNVLLAPGTPKVIDFGIARAVQSTTGTTRIDQVIGSLAYLAPERLGGGAAALSPAADIFAWGGVITYAGTGRAPFPAETAPLMMARILTEPPDLTGLPERLRYLVGHAMAKDANDRPSARELLDLLLTADPYRSADVGAALARQPALRVAVEGAQAAARRHVGPVPHQQTSREREPDHQAPDHQAPDHQGPDHQGPAQRASDRHVPIGGARDEGRRDRRRGRRLRRSTFLVLLLVLAALGAGAGTVYGLTELDGNDAANFAVPTGGELVVQDPMTAQGNWRNRTEEAFQASCTVEAGLVVTKQGSGPFRCAGVRDTLSDVSVAVDVTIATKGSCAGIWFRFSGSGYALRVCAGGYYLVAHGGEDPTAVVQLQAFRADAPTKVGTPMRVGIVAQGTTMSFYRDGQYVGRWEDGRFQAGRVLLGIFGESTQDPPPYRVSYANFEMYRLPG